MSGSIWLAFSKIATDCFRRPIFHSMYPYEAYPAAKVGLSRRSDSYSQKSSCSTWVWEPGLVEALRAPAQRRRGEKHPLVLDDVLQAVLGHCFPRRNWCFRAARQGEKAGKKG